jgi:hypothetical protein
MTSQSVLNEAHVKEKAQVLGIAPDILFCALNLICRNKNLVNAMDHTNETDDYIYRAILKQAFDKRKAKAEADLESSDPLAQIDARKDLVVLSREEVGTDPFYRAVLPLIAKVLGHEPILRLHAEEASAVVLKLADFKRRHRATSFTEIIVKRCAEELQSF